MIAELRELLKYLMSTGSGNQVSFYTEGEATYVPSGGASGLVCLIERLVLVEVSRNERFDREVALPARYLEAKLSL